MQTLNGHVRPIAVYTMAKVASSSIYHSIKDQTDLPVYHIHSLDHQKIRSSEILCKQRGIIPASRQVGHLLYSKKIQKQKPLIILSTVRDPISRNISAFFDGFYFHVGKSSNEWIESIDHLTQQYFIKQMNHTYPLQWFDDEFKKMTTVDVYKTEFNHEDKYTIINYKNLNILILRVDLKDQLKTNLIKEMIGLDNFTLNAKNVSATKSYATLYKKFIAEVKLPKQYVESMLESKYAKHFYSDEERNTLYIKYTK